MIRPLVILVLLTAIPAHAQDNNPFSGATGIRVEMTREGSVNRTAYRRPHVKPTAYKPFRLRCTLNGKPFADWRGHRVRLGGETLTVPADAAGPMIVLLWAGGARCGHK